MSHFTKLAATGKPARANAKNHAAVIDQRSQLMWTTIETARLIHQAAQAHVDKLNAERYLGFADWRLPTVQELFGLVDHTRSSPAIDTDAFPHCKSLWYWTDTPCAWSSGHAWFVNFSLGYVGYGGRDYLAFVRAVRRVSPAGQ
jgi:hypothetical protein